MKTNIIDLKHIIYSKNKPLNTEVYGEYIYDTIDSEIDYNVKNVFIFPKEIDTISISFCIGFTKNIFRKIFKDEFYDYFDIEGSSRLTTKFRKSIYY